MSQTYVRYDVLTEEYDYDSIDQFGTLQEAIEDAKNRHEKSRLNGEFYEFIIMMRIEVMRIK